jgi:hypothetical protein
VKRRKRPVSGVVGWREWLGLPELGIDRIKVKVDTGARTSALHAFDIERIERGGEPWLRFEVHPIQRDAETSLTAEAPLVDERWVTSSTGKRTFRPVVRVEVALGTHRWPIELTLVRRDMMGFRMLLGRQALRDRFVVDPRRSYLEGRSLAAVYPSIHTETS